MSRFRENNLVHKIARKSVVKSIFRLMAYVAVFAALEQVIFAESVLPALPTESIADFDIIPTNFTDSSNLPAISEANPANNTQLAVSIPQKVSSTTNNSATNSATASAGEPSSMDAYVQKLETARYLRKVRRTMDAKPLFVALLSSDTPDAIQRSALLELAALAQDEDDLPRTQDTYAQFLSRWPNDPRVPEVLLRQGQVFRQMGIHDLALTKFYAVMTAALTLRNDRLDYYETIVLKAQMEIAETHYELGKYAEAAEYFSRLFKQDNPQIDKHEVLYKLVRCYGNTTNYDQTVASAHDYLANYANTPEVPEVRFELATSLKELGRDNESLQQVLTLLKEQSNQANSNPENWAYWQQRTGNLIANQFFREGDYPRALDIYSSLAHLDPSPQWQLPVWYQMGMTYERLWQPQKATEIYNQIVSRENELDTNAPPSLKSIVDMARWRINFIQWQNKAETANYNLRDTNIIVTANTANEPIKQ